MLAVRASSVSGLPFTPCIQDPPRSTGISDQARLVHIRPPRRFRASRITTSYPALAKVRAALRPAIPAPTTIIGLVLSEFRLGRGEVTGAQLPKASRIGSKRDCLRKWRRLKEDILVFLG